MIGTYLMPLEIYILKPFNKWIQTSLYNPTQSCEVDLGLHLSHINNQWDLFDGFSDDETEQWWELPGADARRRGSKVHSFSMPMSASNKWWKDHNPCAQGRAKWSLLSKVENCIALLKFAISKLISGSCKKFRLYTLKHLWITLCWVERND